MDFWECYRHKKWTILNCNHPGVQILLSSWVCWFKIARQNYFVHICSLTNGLWIKVDEKIFQKVCCYNEKFMCWNNPNINFKVAKVISWAWNFDGPWFYVPSILVEPYCSRNNSFLLHLNLIKLTFWVAPRITKGIIVSPSWLFA
jgi:hypothetical protein